MSRAIIILSLLAFACNNLEDAAIPERNTYIRFFGSPRSYEAVAAEPDTDGGFIIIGNAEGDTDLPAEDPASRPSIVVIKTNAQGVKVWEHIYPDARANSILPLADGYLITGDGIELNRTSAETSELENFKFRLMKTDLSGNITQEFTKDSTVTVNRGAGTVDLKVDFHASASVLLPGGEVATLGSYQVPGGLQRIITVGFNVADITTPVWRKNFVLDNFDYINARSLNFSQGNLVWASTASPQNPNESKYISVIAAPPNYASPSNNSLLGKNEDRAHVVNDIQRSATGFAVIGNYSERDGSQSNIFFGRVDPAGTIIPGSIRYFNGYREGGGDLTVDKTTAGSTQDYGDAITYTRDGGFVLACSIEENPLRGNGGLDIILIKVDAFGNYLWDKLLGGGGNERVNSIRELPDGSLLICGTEEISNVSSIFIIKADKNGDLKD